MDTGSLGYPCILDSEIRVTPLRVDRFTGKICVVECIREKDGKVRIQMSKKTHTNPLSKREIEELRKSPHIVSVSANTVRFTEEFKKLAYEAKTRGISVAETMRRNGIDPYILGNSRVEGFSYTLNKKAKRESGFSDGRSENYRRPPKTGEETVDQRIRQLENELAYTRQEVEFLKKLQAANTEAQKQWESRHRQK